MRGILYEKCFKKTFLIMKLNLALLILSTFSALATSYSQNTRVNVSVENGTIVDIFNQIENQSEFRVFYRADEIDLGKKYTVNYNNEQVGVMLADLLKESNSTFEVVNKIIVITPSSQQTKVTGKVIDVNTGESLPGVNILVEGTNTGVVTDSDGKFSLELSASDGILIFSYIGYNTERIEINGRSTVDVALVPDIQMLDEVVVVGYGTMKKRDVTGSIASIKEDEFKNLTITNTTEILKGRVAGVSVTESSGKPGGEFKIRIRGANSILGDNSPLLVVDGIQTAISLDQINPNDIASIDILKDASATAIYGSRGANGVILLTTKNGAEGPPVVEISSYLSFKKAHNPYDMMEAGLYAETLNITEGNPIYSQSEIDAFRTSGGYNMYDALLQNGLMQSYKVGLRGGTKALQYFISGGYDHEDGVLINTNFSKYMIRSNFSSKISDKLSLGLNLNATKSSGHNIRSGYEALLYANLWGPTEKIINDDGTYNLKDTYGANSSNPYMILNESNVDNSATVGIIAANIKYEILSGLTFDANVGYNMGVSNNGYVNNDTYGSGVEFYRFRQILL